MRVRIHATHEYSGFGKAFEQKFEWDISRGKISKRPNTCNVYTDCYRNMTAQEILEILIESIEQRAREINEIQQNTTDANTKPALAENHRKSMEQLEKSKEELKKLKSNHNHSQ